MSPSPTWNFPLNNTPHYFQPLPPLFKPPPPPHPLLVLDPIIQKGRKQTFKEVGNCIWRYCGGSSSTVGGFFSREPDGEIPSRRRGHFNDNINLWEMPFEFNFLPLWMLFFFSSNICFLPLELIMISNELCPLVFYHHWLRYIRSLIFLDWPNQGLCRIYISSSTRHHIFVFFATFLEPKNCCRNYVDPGTKGAKTSSNMSLGPKWAFLRRNISPRTEFLTLIFNGRCPRRWYLVL